MLLKNILFTLFMTVSLADARQHGPGGQQPGSGRRHHIKIGASASRAAVPTASVVNFVNNPKYSTNASASAGWSSKAQSSSTASSSFATGVSNPTSGSQSASRSASRSASATTSSSASTGSASASSSSSSNSSTTTSSSNSSSSSWSTTIDGLSVNGIYVGFLPDDGSGGGTSQTLADINSAISVTSAAQGWYAQAESGTTFTGSQFTARKSEIVASGGVFQPAVMPTGGWEGLTSDDNSQAKAICNVMQEFIDEGLEVWLRFAHEVNYYQTDGTYSGDENDFKEAWAAVAAICQPMGVKMWFTPNIASLSEYEKYYPDDPSTVDLIGIDYYPKDTSSLDFVGQMQEFHDKYTSDTTKFAIGEIGLGVSATMATRKTWLTDITSAATASAMPNYIAMTWFNYYKGYDFRIADCDGDSVIKSFFND